MWMNRNVNRIFIAVKLLFPLFLLLLSGCGSGGKETGEKKTAVNPRIITTAPSLTEIIDALGLADNLIAVSDYDVFPPLTAELPRVGGLYNPNVEEMIRLNPDYILCIPSLGRKLKEIKPLSGSIVTVKNETVEDILDSITLLGRLLNREDRAGLLRRKLRNKLKSMPYPEKIKIALIISRRPGSLEDIYVAGGKTYFSRFLESAGFDNVYDGLPNSYSKINLESLILKQPEVIIESEFIAEDTVIWERNTEDWKGLTTLAAVKKGNIFRLQSSFANIPGVRIFSLPEYFRKIRGEVLRDKN
jgi:iron complex transport system substrate-binding protein